MRVEKDAQTGEVKRVFGPPVAADPLADLGPAKSSPVTGVHQSTDILEMPRKWTPELSKQPERKAFGAGGEWYWCGAYRPLFQSFTVVRDFNAFVTAPAVAHHELPSTLGADPVAAISPTSPGQGALPGILHQWTEQELETLAYKLDRLHVRLNGAQKEFVDWGTARLEVEAARKLLADEDANDPDPKVQRMIEALRTDTKQELAARAMQRIEPCLESDLPVACFLFMVKVPAEGVAQIEREQEGFRVHRPTNRVLRWRPSWASWPYAMPRPVRELTPIQIKAMREYFKQLWYSWDENNKYSIIPQKREETMIRDLEKEFEAMLSTYGK